MDDFWSCVHLDGAAFGGTCFDGDSATPSVFSNAFYLLTPPVVLAHVAVAFLLVTALGAILIGSAWTVAASGPVRTDRFGGTQMKTRWRHMSRFCPQGQK